MAQNNATIISKVYLEGSTDMQRRLPDPVVSTLAQVENALFDPQNKAIYNEFVETLVNVIGRSRVVNNKTWENRLGRLMMEPLPFGSSIQTIAPRWIKGHAMSVDNGALLLSLARPEVEAAYHSVNYDMQYDIDIDKTYVQRAFHSEYGLNDLVSAIMRLPYNADNWDFYNATMNLFAWYENGYGFYKQNIAGNIATEAGAREFIASLKSYAEKMQFPSMLYNAGLVEVPTYTNPEDMVLMVTPFVKANLETYGYGTTFHIGEGEARQPFEMVVVDEFPIPNTYAALVDKDWFVIADQVYDTDSFWNPMSRTTKHILTHTAVISCNPFANAVIFGRFASTDVPVITQAVTGATLTRASATAKPGDKVQMTFGLTGTVQNDDGDDVTAEWPLEPKAATWAISTQSGVYDPATFVDRFGVLHVSEKAEAGEVITVTATAAYVNPSGQTGAYVATPVTVTVQ